MLVQIARGADDRIRESGFVQHGARFLGKIGEVAEIQTDSLGL